MASSPQTLILFDIDGTLIHTGRAGLRGMNAAFRRLHGRDNALDGVSFAGRTDRAITVDVFRNIDLEPTDAAILALRDAYLEDLRVEIARPVADPGGIFPGVLALLAALERRADVAVGLLTGNFAGGAEIKLGHFDLWRRFAFGAFGDEHHDRRDLVPVALARARERGCVVDAASTVIIGDTPLDIDCAHAHGARAIAVATGPFTTADLAHADLVVPTLEAVDAAAIARR